jgi:DNA-binding HxlR family transcriptional regulator
MPLDKIIHERVRLLILTHLASAETKAVSFSELLEALGLTPGNLSVQLRRLREAKYLTIRKRFKDNKPLTTVSLTPLGAEALGRYVETMEGILRTLKK